MVNESSPLLQFPGLNGGEAQNFGDLYQQFCHLTGLRPQNLPAGQKFVSHPDTLYSRATKHRRKQGLTYGFTATLTNSLLLSQVVLGATLTALGASDSSRVLITLFGASNTVIAGLIAFLKSRGQPMRARMFRDDLDRVVDEIENSATMWLGISRGVHGYDAIDTDDQVTVRGEVARLTRLYDRAVATNSSNDPDNYMSGTVGDSQNTALRSRNTQPAQPAPAPAAVAPAPAAGGAAGASTEPAPVSVLPDPDASPATKPPEMKRKDTDKSTANDKKPTPDETTPSIAPALAPPPHDATAADKSSADRPADPTASSGTTGASVDKSPPDGKDQTSSPQASNGPIDQSEKVATNKSAPIANKENIPP